MKTDFAPLRGLLTKQKPWEGSTVQKPWNYNVTAAIPCLDTYEQIKICTELLNLQSEKPYILIIDTGSCPEQYQQIETLRSDNIEVHALRLNGVMHPSDFPAMAMDMAFTLCRTPFIFATHADCFLRRQNFLEDMLYLCKTISPVVGYQMSERNHADWKGMVSHTATMYHMPTMDRIGFGWSMRRLCNMYNMNDYRPSPIRPNWPDTEILGNYILRMFKITPHLIGEEVNFSRQKDENIDHFRSFTSGKLYSPEYFRKARTWWENAREEALARISVWEKELQEKNTN